MNVKAQSKQAIFGFLAASIAIGATGGYWLSRQQDSPIPRINIEGAPAVASTHGGGPIPEDSSLAAAVRPKNDAATDNANITRVVAALLGQAHYLQQPLDDAMSERFLTRLLDELDPQHIFFFQSDLEEFAKYKTTLDDLTIKGDISPATVIFSRFKERVKQQTEFSSSLLKSEKFDFSGESTYLVDRKAVPAPANLEEAKKLWAERVRYEYLQEKLNNKKPEMILNDLEKRYSRIARTVRQLDDYDIAERYLTSLAHAYDPHTDYLGKASTEAFAINNIRLSLVGIGAQLMDEDGYTKIVELIPGGPAEQSGLLKPGDRIVAVAQGTDGEPVDVVDMKIDKVVEMIRGQKGTTVRLTIIPVNAPDPSTRKVITLVRDNVKIEEQAAKAQIIEAPDKNGKMVRLGVIDLPTFYADPRSGKSATSDIEVLLKKLQEEKVAGVILDLRRNGGGLLTEAVSLTGLFIKQGPVVQVRSYTGSVRKEEDDDPAIAYDGPLVVLTSRFSASASEIVAGALQDYGRAIIVGEASTYGKGTVQVVQPLKEVMSGNRIQTSVDPGTLHLTVQKFYRASGASTQLKGVTPDIVLPAATDVLEIGERFMKFPLPWDTIAPAAYEKTNRVAPYIVALRENSTKRLTTDSDFQYLRQQIARATEQIKDKSVSLNEQKRRQELEEAKARTAQRRKQLSGRQDTGERYYPLTVSTATKPGLPKPMTAKELVDSLKRPRAVDPDEAEDEPDVPEVDFHLTEARRILSDYIGLVKK